MTEQNEFTVDVTYPKDFAEHWRGFQSTSGQIIEGPTLPDVQQRERFSFGSQQEAEGFAAEVCAWLHAWKDSYQGGTFLVTLWNDTTYSGQIGSDHESSPHYSA